MCLAIPALVKELEGELAQVDFGGVRRRIHTGLVPGVAVGNYVLVHAGVAIQVVDLEEAQRTLELVREVYADLAAEELGDGPADG